MSHVVHFDKATLRKLQKQFFKISKESSENEYAITRDQFTEALKLVGIHEADKEIMDRLFTLMDKAGDGLINFREFVVGTSVIAKGTLEEKLKLSFELYDIHETNKVSKDELREMIDWMSKTATFFGDQAPTEEAKALLVDQIFQESDVDHSNDLDFKQFLDAVHKHPILLAFLDQLNDSKYLEKKQ